MGPLVWRSRTILCNFGSRHLGEPSCEIFFKFEPVVQEEMSFKEKAYGCRDYE